MLDWLKKGGLYILILMLAALACQKNKVTEAETLLVKIGDKSISVNEFIRRAEYTIRPNYCRQDNYIQRKIILNSLIAEKLMSLEAGPTLPIFENKRFMAALRGRQEQAMRQWLYYRDFVAVQPVDEKQVEEQLKLANRRYNINYITTSDSSQKDMIDLALQKTNTLAEVLKTIAPDESLPQRTVTLSKAEHPDIIEALYTGRPEKDDIIGPLNIEGVSTWIQIDGWQQQMIATEDDRKLLKQDIAESIQTGAATVAFKQYVSNLMKGKQLVFSEQTFTQLVKALGPSYLKTQKEKEAAFNQRMWDADGEIFNNAEADLLDRIWDEPLLKFDDQVWTVRDLQHEIDAHPLVFRERHIKQGAFAEQLKLAVADLIRDKFVTQDAYAKGLDKSAVIQRDLNMWKDHYASIIQRDRILAHSGKRAEFFSNPLPVLHSTLNPYVASLLKKYDEQIEINTDVFEKIQLSRINTVMMQRGVPYPVMVPGFPVVTTHDRLDFGSKM